MSADARHTLFSAWTEGSGLRVLEPVRALFRPRLDFAALPDHMKRDLGFSTGRPTRPRDPLRD